MPQHDVVASCTRVSKRYGTTEALRDVDLRIRTGEAVALLGPNGAGKTTAVNLLLGILTPSSGRVRVFGNDPSIRASRQRLGVENRLYGSGVVARNSACTSHSPSAATRNCCFWENPPQGLDVTSRRALWDELRKLVEAGRAIVLTTHNIEEAETLADQIVVLDQGRVIASGTPAEIKRATSLSRIAAVTTLERATIDAWPNVTHVRHSTDRTEIFASRPEPVVRQLLALDPELGDLEVTRTTLEEAFLTLTQSDLRP